MHQIRNKITCLDLNTSSHEILKNVSMHYMPSFFESLKPKLRKLTLKDVPKLKDLIRVKLDPFSHLLYSGV